MEGGVDRMKDENRNYTNAPDFRGDGDKHEVSIRHSA